VVVLQELVLETFEEESLQALLVVVVEYLPLQGAVISFSVG
jgi:hypothetical protein